MIAAVWLEFLVPVDACANNNIDTKNDISCWKKITSIDPNMIEIRQQLGLEAWRDSKSDWNAAVFACLASHAKLIADEKSQSGTQDPPERIYTVCNFVGVGAHGFACNQHWYIQILITKCPGRAWTTALWQTYQGKPLGPTNSCCCCCCCRNKDL